MKTLNHRNFECLKKKDELQDGRQGRSQLNDSKGKNIFLACVEYTL